jgi:quercetin dioxygenase-like cupin family protein
MPFIDVNRLNVIERGVGWRGRLFHSANMTFGHWEFDQNGSVHEHSHEQEEVWQVISGELEITIAGATHQVGPGAAAIVPPNAPHSLKVLRAGKAIVVDFPLRHFD